MYNNSNNKNFGWNSEYDNNSLRSSTNAVISGQYGQNLHHSSIGQRMSKLFKEQLYTDVKLILDCGIRPKPYVLAHRAILCIGSSKFAEILQARDGVPPIAVEIRDIPFKAFSCVVEYLYTDEVYFGNDDQVIEILVAARALKVPSLVSRCESFIEQAEVTNDNVCAKLQLASLNQMESLNTRCLQYIQENTGAVIRSRSFKKLEAQTIETICKLPILNLKSEKDLLESVMDWFHHLPEKPSQKNKILNPILRHIRFLTLSPTEFAELLSSIPKVFSDSDALNIVLSLSNKDASKLPSWCSTLPNRCNNKQGFPENKNTSCRKVNIPLKPTSNGYAPHLTCKLQMRCVEGRHAIKALKLTFDGPVSKESTINHLVITVSTQPSQFTFTEKIRICNSEDLEVPFTRLLLIRKGDTLNICAEAREISNYKFLMFDEEKFEVPHSFECSLRSTPQSSYRLFFISGIIYEDAPKNPYPKLQNKRR